MRGMTPSYRAARPARKPLWFPGRAGTAFPSRFGRLIRFSRLCFVPLRPTKQHRAGMKPFFPCREGRTKPVLVTKAPTKTTGRMADSLGTIMIKALSAVAAAAFVAAAFAVLPGLAPQVDASPPHALAKGDRLDYHPVGRECSEQTWPNFEASCLRRAGTKTDVRVARLVTADRTP